VKDQMYMLAIDQGTTSSRAILFDRQGEIRGIAQKEFRQLYPKPGWVEHDAEEIWEVTRWVVDHLFESTGVRRDQVAGIGITNQRETTVVWDKDTGSPVYHAIVWQSRQTADICEDLKRGGWRKPFVTRPGWWWTPTFPGPR